MVSRDPASDPADDCEPGRRGSTGLRFDDDEPATNFLVGAGLPFFSTLAGDAVGISSPVVAVLPEEPSSPGFAASSSEPRGDMNRAVGLVPDVEGTLTFIRMEWGGGGFADDGVRSLDAGGSGGW